MDEGVCGRGKTMNAHFQETKLYTIRWSTSSQSDMTCCWPLMHISSFLTHCAVYLLFAQGQTAKVSHLLSWVRLWHLVLWDNSPRFTSHQHRWSSMATWPELCSWEKTKLHTTFAPAFLMACHFLASSTWPCMGLNTRNSLTDGSSEVNNFYIN